MQCCRRSAMTADAISMILDFVVGGMDAKQKRAKRSATAKDGTGGHTSSVQLLPN